MSAAQYLIGGAVLIAGATFFGDIVMSARRVPLAMHERARNVIICFNNTIYYENLSMNCGTPLGFSDFRKLDMRSDNRSRSTAGGARTIAVDR